MEKVIENPGCPLSGTRYCRLLNLRGCAQCPLYHGATPESVVSDLELYESLLPQGGVAHLFADRECQFCRGETKGVKQGYAIIDMAHPEPRRIQSWLFGKRQSEIGTMIPLQMGICPDCRRRLLLMEYLPVVLPLVFGVLGLVLVNIERLGDALRARASYLPLLVWSAFTAVGAVSGLLAARSIRKRAERVMLTDVLRHPTVREMTRLGWFPITRQSRTKVTFSRSRLARGLGTAADDAAARPNGNQI